MKTTLLIDAKNDAVHAALLEDGVAVEYHVALPGEGALYRARVKTVESKINAAFLDIGDGEEAFLSLRDARALKPKSKSISEAVAEGDLILVKLKAAPAEDGKLATATANPMMAGRYALTGHLPGQAFLSRRLQANDELQALAEEFEDGKSLIIRTNAEAVAVAAVRAEIEALQTVWNQAGTEGETGVVVEALTPLEKILRDYAPHDVAEILMNDRIAHKQAQKMAGDKWPDLDGKITLFDEDTPIMDAFGVTDKIDAAKDGKAHLPSGGTIIIEGTAGMTVIDVNTGHARKGGSPETLYIATNLEAAKAIAAELRFQNLGGLITVDFIDMKSRGDREKVGAVLDKSFAQDTMPVERTNINRFGILSIRRKRRGMALRDALEGRT